MLILSPALAACAGGTGTPAVVVDTLASGVVRVRNRDGGLWAAGGAWKPRELARIGETEGASPYVLTAVSDVEMGPDGRVYVLENRAKELRVFALDGTHLATIGRPGRGPGEFTDPEGLAWGPDGELWVVDVGSQRYTLVSPAGDLVATYPRPVDSRNGFWGGAIAPDGSLYEPGPMVRQEGATRHLFIRYEITGRGPVARDTVELPAAVASSERISVADNDTTFPAPFAPRLSWASARDAGLWFGTGERYRLWHRTLAGDTLRIVELDRPRRRVTRRDLELARRRIRRFADGAPEQVDLARIPDRRAAYGAVLVDDLGWLWVAQSLPLFPGREPEPNPTTFDIFDPDGVYHGALTLDVAAQPGPVISGNRVVGVAYDGHGVPSVVVYWLAGRRSLTTE